MITSTTSAETAYWMPGPAAGCGLSDFPGAMSLDEHADDLHALFDACGVKRRIVGLSIGGLIGQALSFLVRFVPLIPLRCNTPQSLW